MSTTEYDQRYIEIWKDGGLRPVHLKMESVNAAVTLRQRLYRCRQEMKKDKHELYDTAKRAAISLRIIYKDRWFNFVSRKVTPYSEAEIERVELIVQPVDDAFDSALEGAGYKLERPPSLE